MSVRFPDLTSVSHQPQAADFVDPWNGVVKPTACPLEPSPFLLSIWVSTQGLHVPASPIIDSPPWNVERIERYSFQVIFLKSLSWSCRILSFLLARMDNFGRHLLRLAEFSH